MIRTIQDKDFSQFITHGQVDKEALRVATLIDDSFYAEDIILVTVLNGGEPWSKAVRNYMIHPFRNYCVTARSYHGGTESGELEIEGADDIPVKDSIVIILDDVLDTGNTIGKLRRIFLEKGADRVLCCPMCKKDKNTGIPCITQGFNISEKYFLLGEGMDYKEEGRDLSGIYKMIEY